MDRDQQELQFLGFFGILKESFNIIFSWRKIFTQITLLFILPLSFIFLAHIQVSQFLFFKILDNQDTLDHTPSGSPSHAKISNLISFQWAALWLFKFAYFTFLLILSLLSTSAVVYTIACIYTSKPITFKKVLSVVPRVWKRLIVTFLWSFSIVFVYNVIALLLLVLWCSFVGDTNTIGIWVLIVALLMLYFIGLLYVTIVWHMASVVSVLEEAYGFKALVKGKDLIKGKMGVGVTVFVSLGVCFFGTQFLFGSFVVLGWPDLSLGIRVGIGIICCLLLLLLILFGLVIQTVLYFVCKSYHHENIDKSSLSTHLEVYLCEYVPLKANKDVQMEQF